VREEKRDKERDRDIQSEKGEKAKNKIKRMQINERRKERNGKR